MTNYPELAKTILEKSGGVANIAGVSHCATRLRLAVNDSDKVDVSGLENTPGIMGVIKRNDDIQFVIGTDVSNVYSEFIKLGNYKKMEK